MQNFNQSFVNESDRDICLKADFQAIISMPHFVFHPDAGYTSVYNNNPPILNDILFVTCSLDPLEFHVDEFHTFGASLTMHASTANRYPFVNKNILYRFGTRYDGFEEFVAQNIDYRFPKEGHTIWPKLYHTTEEGPGMIYHPPNSVFNFDSLIHRTAILLAHGGNSALDESFMSLIGEGEGVGRVRFVDDGLESLSAITSSVFLPIDMRFIMGDLAFSLLIRIINSTGADVTISDASHYSCTARIPVGVAARDALHTILSSLRAIYNKHNAGERFIMALVSGINDYYTLVDQSEDGGWFRELLRYVRNTYQCPYGKLFHDKSEAAALFSSQIFSMDDCFRSVASILAVAAALVTVSDPGVEVAGTHIPTISAYVDRSYVGGVSDFSPFEIREKRDILGRWQAQGRVDDEKYGSRIEKNDGEAPSEQVEDQQALARLLQHRHHFAESHLEMMKLWLTNLAKYFVISCSIDDIQGALVAYYWAAPISKKYCDVDIVVPWRWIEPTSILKTEDIVQTNRPTNDPIIYGSPGDRDFTLQSFEDLISVDTSGGITVAKVRLSSLRKNPYLFFLDAISSPKKAKHIVVASTSSDFVLAGASFTKKVILKETNELALLPNLNDLFLCDPDAPIPTETMALCLNETIIMWQNYVLDFSRGTSYYTFLPAASNVPDTIHTQCTNQSYIGKHGLDYMRNNMDLLLQWSTYLYNQHVIPLEYFDNHRMSARTISLPRTNQLIPIIGFGSGTKWQWKKKASEHADSTDPDLVQSIIDALELGFEHLDTAEFYTTRSDIGEGLHRYLAKHPEKKREDIFITDKYSAKPPGVDTNLPDGKIHGPYESAKTSLKLMKIEYLDLFLLHSVATPEGLTLSQAWDEMIQLQKEGLVKNIGVSNFDIIHLKILEESGVLPQVNQFEFHPYLQDQTPGIRDYCKEKGIVIEAYASLIPITKAKGQGPLGALLEDLSKKYDASESKILLKWVHSFGYVTVTTSFKIERMKDILSVYDFQLEEEDILKITEVGNSFFWRSFAISPYASYDDELKVKRGIV
ncbi:hypothetical protein CANINC_004186 [Pichia inconspicua]|uniref:NADP-dependent oxidoreductase domain-containing protein n=1 Tax=Pichia inconspicua TaxID=52247 RepID=A0A4T0WWR2_9ASCO|nr:hypothetical protein CANINC_004186 [[Candida] inconspicua]